MAENRGIGFLDYLLILSKWKKFLLLLTVIVAILTYLAIYFLIPAQYDSTVVIVPSEQDQMGGISSLVKSFSNLPVNIPGLSKGKGTDTDLFTTVIYSRTNLDKVLNEFDLYKEYDKDTKEEAVKELTGKINAAETEEGAYKIVVRASTPQKAADINNYIVELLNATLIELNVAKSRDNRVFLERRFSEVKENLKISEDSLVIYQRESGIIMAEQQGKSSFEAYARLEAELASRQIEASVIKRLYGENSPQASASEISSKEFENKLNNIKSGKDKAGLILSINNLPQKTMTYLRHFRDVEIYTKMLAFILPLYEQSRFEEQKNIPLLQVIDKAVPAEKKSYPQRAILTIIITVICLTFILSIIFMYEYLKTIDNPKFVLIKQSFNKK